MDIILASASPRRRELLEQIGIDFRVEVSNLPEHTTQTEPDKVVCDLSAQKADNVWKKLVEEGNDMTDKVVIGADTIVSAWGTILGKPSDAEDAFRMLSSLQGRTHQVYTGVTLYWMQKGVRHHSTFVECTDVTMYPMTEKQIREYIATGEPMDKAGAYGIQGKCAAFIECICGDYYNVVGLPIGHLYQELRNKIEVRLSAAESEEK